MSDGGLAGRVETYLRELNWALGGLPPADRQRITEEINSHLAERAAGGVAALDEALGALGPPHDFARGFVANYELSGALNRASPGRLLLAMLDRATRSAAALLIGFVAVIFYALAAGFCLIAVLKPITPGQVGAWIDAGGLSFGAIYGGPPHTGHELLGYWVIPLAVLLAVACYLLGTVLLRGGARRMLRRGSAKLPIGR